MEFGLKMIFLNRAARLAGALGVARALSELQVECGIAKRGKRGALSFDVYFKFQIARRRGQI